MDYYLDTIALVNNLKVSRPSVWYFYPGMLFRSSRKWWADFGTRHALHEGLDIVMYRNRDGRIAWLDTSINIPAMTAGNVINVCDDFLGQSVIIENESNFRNDARIVTVYSHMNVPKHLFPGKSVSTGESLGRIADTSGRKSGIPCHLHISIMEIKREIPDHMIKWNLMGNPDPDLVKIFNPVDFLRCPSPQHYISFCHNDLSTDKRMTLETGF